VASNAALPLRATFPSTC